MQKRIYLALAIIIVCASMSVAAWGQSADERVLVIQGIGKDEESARNQAYKNAIQSIVGTMVQAETLVVNEELVRDKILSYSNGYITKTEQIGRSRIVGNELVEVTMKVTVKIDMLRAKLKEENITVVEADGESLFARHTTKLEQQQNASTLIADVLKGFPATLLEAKADIDNAKLTNQDNGTVVVQIPIKVTVNKEAWRIFIEQMKKTLEGIAGQPEIINARCDADKYSVNVDDKKLREGDNASKIIIALCENIYFETASSKWLRYDLPLSKDLETLIRGIPLAPDVKVDLLDSSDKEIFSVQAERLSTSNNNPILGIIVLSRGGPLVLFVPLPKVNHNMALSISSSIYRSESDLDPKTKTVIVNSTFVLSQEELRRIKNIRCSIINGSREK